MENSNSTSDFEQKKWLISRIELIIKATLDEWNTSYNNFDKILSEEKEKIRGRRNNILSPFGIFLTIILALYTSGKLSEQTFFILLIADVSLGAFIYFIAYLYLKKTSALFTLTLNELVDSIGKISMLLGHITLKGARWQKVTPEFLQNFLDFVYFCGLSRLIAIQQRLERNINDGRFLIITTRSTFKINSDSTQRLIDGVIENFKTYQPHNDIRKEWYEEAKSLIDSYKKNV